MLKTKVFLFVCFLSIYSPFFAFSATDQSHAMPDYYIIEEVLIKGNRHISTKNIQDMVGIYPTKVLRIPGKHIDQMIQKLWNKNFFKDIQVHYIPVSVDYAKLVVTVEELPKLRMIHWSGSLSSKEKKKIQARIKKNIPQKFIAPTTIDRIKKNIQNYLWEQGYYHHQLKIDPQYHTKDNTLTLHIHVQKKKKIKINKIDIVGNQNITDQVIKNCLLHTKEKLSWKKLRLKFWQKSILIPEKWEKDQQNIVQLYHQKGYLDTKIVKTDIQFHDQRTVNLVIHLEEGKPYFFGNIFWEGNTRYTDKYLQTLLGIQAGDIYNPEKLSHQLSMRHDGQDIRSLYMDEGYLSCQVSSYIKKKYPNHHLDVIIKVDEGKPFYIQDIHIQGNTVTHEKVIRRELHTLPFERFSKKKILRSQREILQLNLFDPAKCNVIPVPVNDQAVDLIYTVEEKPNDEIKGGLSWNGKKSFAGNLSLHLNNFAFRHFFKGKYWSPFPMGDAQKLSFALTTNTKNRHNLSIQIQEPWLYDQKYSSLGGQIHYEIFYASENKDSRCNTLGMGIQRGSRLQWPSDYLFLYYGLSYDYYHYKNYDFFTQEKYISGKAHNFPFHTKLIYNSTDYPFFPTKGAEYNLAIKMTLPYTLWGIYTDWITYQKAMFDAKHYYSLVKKLVLHLNAHAGILGNFFSPNAFLSVFENFYMGGTMGALEGQRVSGDYVTLRGYDNNYIQPKGGILYQKLGLELRYLMIKNLFPMYILGFAEAGNTWDNYTHFNGLDLYTTLGLGIKIQVPLVGNIGLDWAYGFQNQGKNLYRFHLSLGQTIR